MFILICGAKADKQKKGNIKETKRVTTRYSERESESKEQGFGEWVQKYNRERFQWPPILLLFTKTCHILKERKVRGSKGTRNMAH